MTPLPPTDLRQLHADTIRALSENRRKHDTLRTQILEMLAEALRLIRETTDWSIGDVADVAGCWPQQILEIERGMYPPTLPQIEAYLAMQRRTDIRKQARAQRSTEMVIHLCMLPSNLRTNPHPAAACGAPKDSFLGVASDVTCPACMATRAYQATMGAIRREKP